MAALFLVYRTGTMTPIEPSLEVELELFAAGCRLIAGVDEAGRGAMAGPVVAAAVILPVDASDALCGTLAGLRDSKLLTAQQRDEFFTLIHACARAVGISTVSPNVIDTIGIAAAARLAMRGSVSRLGHQADHLLVDAFSVPGVPTPQQGIIKGDQKCLSIAAASVVAKVTRDRLMVNLDECYPGYGLARHKGYVTAAHKQVLFERGPTEVHRLSYAPVAAAVQHWHGGRWFVSTLD